MDGRSDTAAAWTILPELLTILIVASSIIMVHETEVVFAAILTTSGKVTKTCCATKLESLMCPASCKRPILSLDVPDTFDTLQLHDAQSDITKAYMTTWARDGDPPLAEMAVRF